ASSMRRSAYHARSRSPGCASLERPASSDSDNAVEPRLLIHHLGQFTPRLVGESVLDYRRHEEDQPDGGVKEPLAPSAVLDLRDSGGAGGESKDDEQDR